ncbi:MAG: response regulator [Chloroflexi bacterium]|nr:response regulator [Chloroflexota bacterium]
MAGTLRNTSIIIVEDDCDLLDGTRKLFELQGARVQAFESAGPALDSLNKHGADLLIVDLGLPNIDGLTLISRVRDLDSTLPVIVITAWQTAQSAVSAAQLGISGYIRKPAPPKLLIQQALRAVAPRQLEQELNRQAMQRAIDDAHSDAVKKIAESIPHELLQPLTLIQGYASLIRDEAPTLSPEVAEYIEQIIHGCNRLQELILAFQQAQLYTTRQFGGHEVFDAVASSQGKQQAPAEHPAKPDA